MLTSDRNAPSLRIRTPESTARALREEISQHNLRVVLLAAGTVVMTAALWLLLYFVCTWIVVVALPILDKPQEQMPRGFPILFLVAALCAVVYAWVDRWLTPNERARDKKSAGEIFSELVLAIPRMTLSIGGTLAAWQKLEPSDYLQAAMLLHRIAEEKRVAMSSVRLDILDPTAALRILFALQITQVIDIQRDGQELWLKLNALRPAALRLSPQSLAGAGN